MQSRDITIFLLWFTIVHYSSLFQFFFINLQYYCPYSTWKFLIFYYFSLLTFFAYNNIDWLMNPDISHHKVVMVSQASICICEWSIHYCSLSAMFTPLHSRGNQELFNMHVCSQSSHYENYKWCCTPNYHLKLELAMFNSASLVPQFSTRCHFNNIGSRMT